jgi:hypothetical protein
VRGRHRASAGGDDVAARDPCTNGIRATVSKRGSSIAFSGRPGRLGTLDGKPVKKGIDSGVGAVGEQAASSLRSGCEEWTAVLSLCSDSDNSTRHCYSFS